MKHDPEPDAELMPQSIAGSFGRTSRMILFGTTLNIAAIVMGGIAGLWLKTTPSQPTQASIRTLLGVVTVFAGLHLSWIHLGTGFWNCAKSAFIGFLSLGLGNLLGGWIGVQRGSNRLGQYASSVIERSSRPGSFRSGDLLIACTILYCAAPLSVLGCLQEGLTGDWRSFAIKAVVDGIAALSFTALFGWTALLAIVPVAAWQGSFTMGVALAAPWLKSQGLVESIQLTSGLILCCVSVLILDVKKVRVADYLPGLLLAPIINYFWR